VAYCHLAAAPYGIAIISHQQRAREVGTSGRIQWPAPRVGSWWTPPSGRSAAGEIFRTAPRVGSWWRPPSGRPAAGETFRMTSWRCGARATDPRLALQRLCSPPAGRFRHCHTLFLAPATGQAHGRNLVQSRAAMGGDTLRCERARVWGPAIRRCCGATESCPRTSEHGSNGIFVAESHAVRSATGTTVGDAARVQGLERGSGSLRSEGGDGCQRAVCSCSGELPNGQPLIASCHEPTLRCKEGRYRSSLAQLDLSRGVWPLACSAHHARYQNFGLYKPSLHF